MKKLTILITFLLLLNKTFGQENCAFKVVMSSSVDCTKRNVVGVHSINGIPKKLFRRKMDKIKLSGVTIECELEKLVNLFSSICKIRGYRLITIEVRRMYENEDDPSRCLALTFSYCKH